MKKIVLFLKGLLLMASVTTAQQGKGNVKDQQSKAVEKATVSLLSGKDSSVETWQLLPHSDYCLNFRKRENRGILCFAIIVSAYTKTKPNLYDN